MVILLFDGVQSLTFSSPMDVLAEASTADFRYDIRTVSRNGRPVRSSSRLVVVPDMSHADVSEADTVIFPGADGIPSAYPETASILTARATRFASVCTGAFVLAETGVLNGRKAATHWRHAHELSLRHPAVKVDARNTVIRDGSVLTAGGVASGIELGLALIEEDLGRETAQRVARHLVTYVNRPGGQTQFATLRAKQAQHPAPREAQGRVLDRPAGELTVAALARHAGLSERHFTRRFRAQVGMSAKE
ncbi:GlxA family transcriptional regulator [Streptomyces sp. NPDC090106]|uniref:GlxA family transcriptional regulator n=1 Tax=Streptomyces sp. NPDC090106 TaxID=3365946 RepID=UPI00381F14D1